MKKILILGFILLFCIVGIIAQKMFFSKDINSNKIVDQVKYDTINYEFSQENNKLNKQVLTLIYLKEYYSKTGKKQEGLEFLNKLHERIKNDPLLDNDHSLILMNIAGGYEEFGEKEKADAIISRLSQDFISGLKRGAELTCKSFLESGQIDKAFEMLEKSKQLGEKIVISGTIAKYYFELNDKVKCLYYLDECLKTVDIKTGDLRYVPIFFQFIADLYYKLNDRDKYYALLSEVHTNINNQKTDIERPYEKIQSLLTLASGYKKINSESIADQILKEVLVLCDTIKYPSEKFYYLNRTLGIYKDLNKKEKCLELLDNMYQIQKTEKVRDVDSFAVRYIQLEEFDKGLKITDEITDTQQKISALIKIAETLNKMGKQNNGKETLQKAYGLVKNASMATEEKDNILMKIVLANMQE